MDDAHLLQRPGRNLSIISRRNRPTPRSPPATHKTHWPPVFSPRRSNDSHLHRRLTLLRRKSLARLSQPPTPHLTQLYFVRCYRPCLSLPASLLFHFHFSYSFRSFNLRPLRLLHSFSAAIVFFLFSFFPFFVFPLFSFSSSLLAFLFFPFSFLT